MMLFVDPRSKLQTALPPVLGASESISLPPLPQFLRSHTRVSGTGRLGGGTGVLAASISFSDLISRSSCLWCLRLAWCS